MILQLVSTQSKTIWLVYAFTKGVLFKSRTCTHLTSNNSGVYGTVSNGSASDGLLEVLIICFGFLMLHPRPSKFPKLKQKVMRLPNKLPTPSAD